MRVEAITFEKKVSKRRLAGTTHLSDHGESDGNWITILVGNNGCGKSLLLRLLAEGGLGFDRYNGHGQSPVKFSMQFTGGSPPSKVIALSGTPLDRFPRGGGRDVVTRLNLNQYDRSAYVYLGQRAANGVSGAMESQRSLASLYLRHSGALHARDHALQAALKPIGLSPNVGFRVQPSSAVRTLIKKGRVSADTALDKQLTIAEAALQRSSGRLARWEAETRFFIECARKPGPLRDVVIDSISSSKARDVAFELGPQVQQFNAGLQTISDWKCAIRLGIFEVDALEFKSADEKSVASFRDSDLSSGQWNWITTLIGLALELEDNALILIDEPENSLHPEWQRNYVTTVNEVLTIANGCHILAATHSALIASGLAPGKGEVRHLQKVHPDQERVELVTSSISNAFGWSAQDVYDEVFNVTSTRSPEFIDRANQALKLISAGAGQGNPNLTTLVAGLVVDAEKLPIHDPMRQVVDSMKSHINGTDDA